MAISIEDEAESYLRELAASWVRPEKNECLACFVIRMLGQFGCADDLRFATAFRDARAPQATALERKLVARGGFCDCKVAGYVYVPHRRPRPRGGEMAEAGVGADAVDAADPCAVPPCAGVRAGSAQGCALWRKPSRYRW